MSNVTVEKDQEDRTGKIDRRVLAFGLFSPAMSKEKAERPYQFSRLSGSFFSSSSLTPSDTGEYFAIHFPRFQNNRGVFPCPTKEFPRTEKVFPRTVQ